MKALLISIGDELLIGQTINTNAAWIGARLTDIGIKVEEVLTIPDDPLFIKNALQKSVDLAYNFVIVTGGLGPTKDDLTKKVFADFFDAELVRDEAVLENIKAFFKAYNRSVSAVNEAQALVPKGAKVLMNKKGTAPGMWMEKGGTVCISLPGVPTEMQYIMEVEVIPFIQNHYSLPAIFRKTLLTQGIGESYIAEILSDLEDNLPSHIKLAYLPSAAMVKLRLSAYGSDVIALQEEVLQIFTVMSSLLKEYTFGWDNDTLEGAVVAMLQEKKHSLAIAESLSGGIINKAIASIPGVSAVYKGGVVAYQNEIKQRVLNISPRDIEDCGAVSKAVVQGMAYGIKNLMKSDWAIATSGIAGPDGGTDENPVGTVWIAVAGPDFVEAKRFQLGAVRDAVVKRTERTALKMLYDFLLRYSA